MAKQRATLSNPTRDTGHDKGKNEWTNDRLTFEFRVCFGCHAEPEAKHLAQAKARLKILRAPLSAIEGA